MGQEKTVDDILCAKNHAYDFANRDVEIVLQLQIVRGGEFPVRSRVNELLAGDTNDDIAGRHLAFDLGPDFRAANINPEVENDNDGDGDENPGKLFEIVALNVGRRCPGRRR
jgi:hypothetical protein